MSRAKMSSKERVLAALNLEVPDRVPWIESFVAPQVCAALLGRPVETPAWARVPPEVFEVLALDNISFDLRAPEFAERMMSDGMLMVGRGYITGWDKLDIIKLPDPHDERMYEPMKEYLKKHKRDKLAMVCMRAGPANAYLSIGMEPFSLMMYDDPKFIKHVIGIFADWHAAVMEHLNEMDVDMVRIGEDWAHKTGPFFSPKMIREFFIPPFKKVIERLKKPWIYHSDGNIMPYLDDVLRELKPAGITNIEPGAMDIVQLKKDYGKRTCLIGNIDLNYTLTLGTPEEVEREVKERIEVIGKGGGYILASSNSITNYCKPENVLAVSRTLEKYGYYE